MRWKTKLVELVLGVLVVLCPFESPHAQTLQEQHGRIRRAIDSADLNTAVAELRTVRSSNPTLFSANNYDYLLGRLSERQADRAGSFLNYQAVVARNSPLSQYALWHLAQMARSMGDLILEREQLRQLIYIAPNSLLREAATMRLGQSLFESAEFSSAVSALDSLTKSSNAATAREALNLIAQANLKAGKKVEAREAFTGLVLHMPDASRPDDYALSAVRALDSLDSAESVTLSEAEHLLRASVYQFNRDFDAARIHYLAVVQTNPQGGTVPNALYQVGRGFYQQQQYDEALKQFQRVVDQFAASSSVCDSLTSIGSTYGRLKRTDEAVAAYKRFLDRCGDAPNPERSYLNIIDSLQEDGRYEEALDWVQQARRQFKDQPGSALALFAQTRIHLAQGSWARVVSDVDELTKASDLGGARMPGGTTPAEVAFLRAYALEKQGNSNDAITTYLSIPDGRNEYYGRLATARLHTVATAPESARLLQSRAASLLTESKKALQNDQLEPARRFAQDALRLNSDPAGRMELLQILKRTYEGLPAYKLPIFRFVALGRQDVVASQPGVKGGAPTHRTIANELLFLGLYDEGAPEFAADTITGPKESARSASLPPDIDYTLALYFLRGDLANRAIRFAEQTWKPVPRDYVLELAPRELLELLYPTPYRESFLKESSAKGVDPRFLLSIARQESRFQSGAKSIAAARGLMQFISATAQTVASELDRHDFRQEDLYNPDVAILFGSQYLSSLFKQFPGQPDAVAASYNSGADNVARWVARSRSNEPARYVAEIGFAQTKDYVFKVMTNYWSYQALYDSQLQAQPFTGK